MKLTELSDTQLSQLIADAMHEWTRRHTPPGAPPPAVSRRKPAAPTPPAIPTPGGDDVDFLMSIAQLVREGACIKAAERQRVASIAETHPEYVRRMKLPVTSNAGDWKRHAEYVGTIRRAIQRVKE